MARRIFHTSFGLGVGIVVRLLLPGHHSIGMLAATTLSFVGALAGAFAAEKLLHAAAEGPAGFVTAAIGALLILLVYGIGV